MHYKLSVDDTYSDEEVENFWASLEQIVDNNQNINYGEFTAPFITEGNAIMLIGSQWGYNRPQKKDMEELSSLFPEVTFNLIQASDILNGDHFEDLKNYTLTEYRNGSTARILKPRPVEWEVIREVKKVSPWG